MKVRRPLPSELNHQQTIERTVTQHASQTASALAKLDQNNLFQNPQNLNPYCLELDDMKFKLRQLLTRQERIHQFNDKLKAQNQLFTREQIRKNQERILENRRRSENVFRPQQCRPENFGQRGIFIEYLNNKVFVNKRLEEQRFLSN